ncbi:amidohydrolase family protein [Idiomarina aminovorans]|uniref:amidohydrolase family protein n=1 Tax=Idiomarina aminovorans TaxID=2914829 RepID=UPI0032B873B0
MTIFDHPKLRDEHACFASSAYAVALADKHQADLHVLHLTTAKELSLFDAEPIATKKVTAEACVHHLWFDDRDYEEYGNLIKCNPAIKSQQDRTALLKAIRNDTLDIIATDHAPHLLKEKEQHYEKAPAGIPLVQHALLILFELVKQDELTIETLVEKTAHNPAIRFKVKDRGFIREGYFADLVLVDMNHATQVSNQNVFYKCQWTPFHEEEFSATIKSTWVNGIQMYSDTKGILSEPSGKALEFERSNYS